MSSEIMDPPEPHLRAYNFPLPTAGPFSSLNFGIGNYGWRPRPPPWNEVHTAEIPQQISARAPVPGRTDEDLVIPTPDHDKYKFLYIAALKGDWQGASRFLEEHAEAVNARFRGRSMTALHVAAMEGKSRFVENLVQIMKEEDVGLLDKKKYTALHYAAIDGNIRSVKALVSKYGAATQLKNKYEQTPLLCAATATRKSEQKEQKEVIRFLYWATTGDKPGCPLSDSEPGCPLSCSEGGPILITYLTRSCFHDISLYLFESHRFPDDDSKKQCLIAALEELARKPSDFPSGSEFNCWERFIYPFLHVEKQNFKGSRSLLDRVPFSKNVRDAKLRHKYAEALLKHACEQLSHYSHEDLTKNKDGKKVHLLSEIQVIAAEHGTVEVIRVCFEYFPEVIWDETATILETAVIHRWEKVVNLLNMPSGRNWMLTNKAIDQGTGTNILHKAAKLAPRTRLQSVSGSPFQLQRELQWYKEMEKLVDPKFVDEKEESQEREKLVPLRFLNKKEKSQGRRTPWRVFLDEHEDLIEKGEKWMRDTSSQLLVVCTLIAGVVFAASITIPGAQDDKGKPRFSGQKSFMVFAISDAVALFSSVISILMFLSILTSRFAPDDFLKSLPRKLIFGLASLWFSIAAITVAFGAALSFLFQGTWTWALSFLAFLPALMFVRLQLPLFVQMVRYTFGSGIFHPEDIWQLDNKGSNADKVL